jgi:hypothetical protein
MIPVKDNIEKADTKKQDFFWLAPGKIVGLVPKETARDVLKKSGSYILTRYPDPTGSKYKLDQTTIDNYFIIRSQGIITLPSVQLDVIKQIANFFFDQFAVYDMNQKISDY